MVWFFRYPHVRRNCQPVSFCFAFRQMKNITRCDRVVCYQWGEACSIHFLVFLDCFGNWLHHRGILSIIPSVHDRFLQSSASHLSHYGKSYIFPCTAFANSLLPVSFFLIFFFISLKIIHFPTVSVPFPFCATMEHAIRDVISSRSWWRLSVCLSVCPCLQTHCCQNSKWREMCDRISGLPIA